MGAALKIDLDSLINQEVFVDHLEKGGFTKDVARLVLAQAATMGVSPEDKKNFQAHLTKDDGSVNVEKIAAYSHVNAIKMTFDSYLPILNDRAENDADYDEGNSKNLEELRSAVEMMCAAGYDAQDMAHVFNNLIKISCSYTSHPTELLSEKGVDLVRNFVKSSESSDPQALKDAVNDIVNSDEFEAIKRANVLGEIDGSNISSRIHNKGVNELDRAIEAMIFDATGEQIDINTNTAPRSWDYDADGKNNAEGFAMMAKMATTKMGALSDLVSNLEIARSGNIPNDMVDKIEAMQNDVQKIIDRLEPVHNKSRDIVLKLSQLEPEKREAFYRENYEQSFKPLCQDLSKIYDEVDGNRDSEAFYFDLVGDGQEKKGVLGGLRKDLESHDNKAAFAIDESYRTLRKCGFALDRGQTRHNDNIHTNMLDNLFASDAFWSLDLLGETDREAINTVGKYSNLSADAQACYFDKILISVKDNDELRAQLIDQLGFANLLAFTSLGDGGNGYPEQERTYGDRTKIRSIFPMIFSEGVISDASADAPLRAKFIADLYGMEEMRHMSLHEDDKTLGKQGGVTTDYNKYGGAANRTAREEVLHPFYRRWTEALHVMRAASDAERMLGSFTRLQAMQQFRDAVREGYKMGVPIEFMIGGGGSLNRFGGDVDMVRRIIAQEVKDTVEEKKANGGEYDELDEKMLMMASSILYTEQGRTKRYISATSNQVRDNFAGKMVNIVQDVLDIRGDVPSHTFIDKRHKFSNNMRAVQNNAINQAMVQYKALTMAVNKGSSNNKAFIMDKYFDMAGCPHINSYMNNGARPEQGKAKGGKKGISDGRAIGKDQASYLAETFHCGIYASGFAMNRFYDRLNANKGAAGSANEKNITLGDIDDLVNQSDWDEAIFSRNLLDAARFNASELFGRVSDKDWSFDRAVEVGSSVQFMNEGKAKGGDDEWVIKAGGLENDYSQEELYLTKIYYDRLLFVSMTEAAITPQGQGVTMLSDKEKIIQEFRPGNNSIEVELGARTKEKWSDVMVALENHKMNVSSYATLRMVNDDIEAKIQSGMSKKAAIASYGGGDFDKGEEFMRKLCASFRAGTMPHKYKWTGENTYGVVNRREKTMSEFLKEIFPNYKPSKDLEPLEPA